MLSGQARSKVLPLIQFDYAVVGTHQGQPHFEFMVETDIKTRDGLETTKLSSAHATSPAEHFLQQRTFKVVNYTWE